MFGCSRRKQISSYCVFRSIWFQICEITFWHNTFYMLQLFNGAIHFWSFQFLFFFYFCFDLFFKIFLAASKTQQQRPLKKNFIFIAIFICSKLILKWCKKWLNGKIYTKILETFNNRIFLGGLNWIKSNDAKIILILIAFCLYLFKGLVNVWG